MGHLILGQEPIRLFLEEVKVKTEIQTALLKEEQTIVNNKDLIPRLITQPRTVPTHHQQILVDLLADQVVVDQVVVDLLEAQAAVDPLEEDKLIS